MPNTVNPLYTDAPYNSISLYNASCICANVPVQIEFDFITTEFLFNVKLFGDHHCQCKEV